MTSIYLHADADDHLARADEAVGGLELRQLAGERVTEDKRGAATAANSSQPLPLDQRAASRLGPSRAPAIIPAKKANSVSRPTVSGQTRGDVPITSPLLAEACGHSGCPSAHVSTSEDAAPASLSMSNMRAIVNRHGCPIALPLFVRGVSGMDVTFFGSASELRAWLAEHHDTAKELLIGFYKKGSGKGGITYQEAVDEALCFGWIDGVRRRLDGVSYTNRFTPRTKRSIWSAVNIKRVGELTTLGRMEPPGLKAFQNRDPARTNLYSSEQKSVAFDIAYEEQFRASQQAWEFFQAQPPSYRRVATHWVMSAKKEETRLRRLATLIEDSAGGRRIGSLTRPTRD